MTLYMNSVNLLYGFQPYKTIDEVRDKFKDIKLDFFEDKQNIILQPKDYLYIGVSRSLLL